MKEMNTSNKKTESEKYKGLISFVLSHIDSPGSLKQIYHYAELLWRNENTDDPGS